MRRISRFPAPAVPRQHEQFHMENGDCSGSRESDYPQPNTRKNHAFSVCEGSASMEIGHNFHANPLMGDEGRRGVRHVFFQGPRLAETVILRVGPLTGSPLFRRFLP